METSTSSTLSPMLMASSVSSLSPQTVWIFSPLILSPASPVRLLRVQASPPLDSLLIGVLCLLWTLVCSASSGLSWRLGTADPSEMSLPVSILLVNFFLTLVWFKLTLLDYPSRLTLSSFTRATKLWQWPPWGWSSLPFWGRCTVWKSPAALTSSSRPGS